MSIRWLPASTNCCKGEKAESGEVEYAVGRANGLVERINSTSPFDVSPNPV